MNDKLLRNYLSGEFYEKEVFLKIVGEEKKWKGSIKNVGDDYIEFHTGGDYLYVIPLTSIIYIYPVTENTIQQD